MSICDKLNPSLRSLPVYQPGRPIEEVARELGLVPAEIIKVASNENPLGPSPKAIEAMQTAVNQSHLYPDGNAFYLKNKLAAKLDLEPNNIILGNGSNEIIEFVSHALLGPSDEIVVSQYCFAIYPLVAMMMGAKVNAVPAIEYGHDLPAMLNAITPETRIVWVANPNNPTGTLAKPDDVRALVESVPDDVLLVMDEATSALDYETERKVCDNLLENLTDQTVFFITHRLSTIRNADMIVMLDKGAIVEVGTHDELMNHRGRYYALYRQQGDA